MFNKLKHSAFTLAEVLITLTIIGVIATMTIPTLVTKYQKQITLTKVKAAYSILTDALKRAEIEHGPMKDWRLEDYGYPGDGYAPLNSFKQVIDTYFFALRKQKYVRYTTPLNGGNNWLQLDNGACISIARYTFYNHIYYDINCQKGPNKQGKDTFVFRFGYGYANKFHNSNGQFGFSGDHYTREAALDNCKQTGGYYSGFYCGALLQFDNWQIKDDYPW